MALGRVFCHAISHRISCANPDICPQWVDDACDNVREAGGDEARADVVAMRLRELALDHLPALLSDVIQDAAEMESFTTAIKQRWQDTRVEQPRETAKCAPLDAPADVRGCSATPHLTKTRDAEGPAKGALRPTDFRLPHNFDPVLFATSDQSQRQFLARKSFSLPVELFFYHIGRVLGQERCPSREQTSLIWSKLTHEETDEWQTLLDRLHKGDTVAADSAGTELLTEHEVLQKLDPTMGKMQDLPCRRPVYWSPSKLKKPVQEDHQKLVTRPATGATARLSRKDTIKSPYF
ncbi:hypothetical protein CERZMDRAFT_103206 [Cercospora zeae-maydis SCOH1-5]|uniref:Uncharacterized protein n=1 Tax=Cercospora zeae-maydis SCOH1-5 TaxID=717836 RepID=A0A6A6EZW4_9PEZI|nr:hypothetical protein CERZMDRAFT_103206 [Cercospora zeae-maydis SCOH1-5]